MLLAWLDEALVRELIKASGLPRFTEKTVSTLEDLLVRLRRIRTDGFALTHAEVDPDALGIAAPIFGAKGEVTAGLSVVALGSRVDTAERRDIITAVRDEADAISRTLRTAAG